MAKMTIDVSFKDTDIFNKLVSLIYRINDHPETPESIKEIIKDATSNIFVDVNKVTVEGCNFQDEEDIKRTVEHILNEKLRWQERLY